MSRFARLAQTLTLFGIAACATPTAPERVDLLTIYSDAERRDMQYATYTPPGWDGKTPLPLVVFLHGGGDDQYVLHEHPEIVQTLDEWIGADRLDPFILVAPHGERGMWTNWHDGSHMYEDWVVRDLLEDVVARYPIREGRANRHLMGISMGGAGTIYMTMHNPELFASATFLSAPIFDEERLYKFLERGGRRGMPVTRLFGPPDRQRVRDHDPHRNFAKEPTPPPKIFFGAGTRDLPGIRPLNEAFHKSLRQRQIEHHYAQWRGGHTYKSWAQLFPVALCLNMGKTGCIDASDPFYEVSSFTPQPEK